MYSARSPPSVRPEHCRVTTHLTLIRMNVLSPSIEKSLKSLLIYLHIYAQSLRTHKNNPHNSHKKIIHTWINPNIFVIYCYSNKLLCYYYTLLYHFYYSAPNCTLSIHCLYTVSDCSVTGTFTYLYSEQCLLSVGSEKSTSSVWGGNT